MKKQICLLFLMYMTSVFSVEVYGQVHTLQQKLETIIKDKTADVGVSVLYLENKKSVAINGNRHYPMQSVYKFHLALAVLHQVDKGHLGLNQQIFIKKSDLLPDTWSPLRDKYPGGNVSLPLAEIIKFSVSWSDNNACDILFRLLGGPAKVHRYIAGLGIKDCSIVATEEEMHKDENVQFRNWSTANAVNALLAKFCTGKVLKKNTTAFLMKVMEETTTGTDKIKGLLPRQTVVAHKTGSSGMNNKGITTASNDVGIVTLKNGKKMLISVFVSMSKEPEKVNDRIIAELAKTAWEEIN